MEPVCLLGCRIETWVLCFIDIVHAMLASAILLHSECGGEFEPMQWCGLYTFHNNIMATTFFAQ